MNSPTTSCPSPPFCPLLHMCHVLLLRVRRISSIIKSDHLPIFSPSPTPPFSPSLPSPTQLLFFFFFSPRRKMLEQAIPTIWASVNSWFTPTVLFVLLNLVIGTIAITSKGIRSSHVEEEAGGGHPDDRGKLSRSPSAVLDRLKSFNLYRYRSVEIPLETAPPPPAPKSETLVDSPPAPASQNPAEEHLINRFVETPLETAPPPPASKSETVVDSPPAPASQNPAEEHLINRSQSDTQALEVPVKLAGRMKKSASAKSAFSHFEAEEVIRQPATTREAGNREEEGGEVDARADDFINRFRQQLKLQRVNSIARYKEMLNRGH